MRKRGGCRAGWVLAGIALVAAPPPAEARTISLAEALALVARDQPELTALRARARAAADEARAVRGHLAPALQLSDRQSWTLSHLDRPGFVAPLVGSGLVAGAGPGRSRFAMNVAEVQAAQPLSGLVRGLRQHSAARERARALGQVAERGQQAAARQVRELFLRLHEAALISDTAQASARDLAQQAEITAQKVAAGSLTEADVLRVRAAVAAAEQQAVVARAEQQILAATLAVSCGLEGEEAVVFAPPEGLWRPWPVPPLAALRQAALERRPDFLAEQAQARAAAREAEARGLAMWPELSAMAAYMQVRLGPFGVDAGGVEGMRASTAMVGLSAEWRAWEWGASAYAWRAARARAAAAAADEAAAARRMGLAVVEAREALGGARKGVEAADRQLQAAGEAWRVMRVLVEAGSASTTDLLASEAAHTQARQAVARARTAAALAQVALFDAAGQPGPEADVP